MVTYACENCNRTFSQKSHFDDHQSRKRPCKKDNTIEALVEKKVKEALTKTNEIQKIDSEPATIDTDKKETMDYSKKTREELIAVCKEKGIKGYSGKKKEDIVKLLTDAHVNEVLAKNEIVIAPPIIKNEESLTLDYNVGNAFDILEKDTKTYKCIYLDPPYASGRDYKFAEKDETAAFTDKFRIELQKRNLGWWFDMDVVCHL